MSERERERERENTHPSIIAIKERYPCVQPFEFKPIDENVVSRDIDHLGLKKATGNDGISTKILKIAKPVIARPIANLINSTITKCHFPIS